MNADLIQELRAGLEGTTKGLWRPGHLANDDHSCNCGFVFDSLDRQGSIATVNMDGGGQFSSEYPSREEAKANLKHIIAAQPDNIRTILDALAAKDTALSEMRAERDEARKQRDEIGRAWDSADARAKAAEAEHSAARRNFHTMQHAANALLKRAEAAEAELALARKALEAGKQIANVAYNICQQGWPSDVSSFGALREAYETWDAALVAARALSPQEEQ